MEYLLNPNIAYLLLVLGFTLAILAVFTPGTGVMEIGALFALLLAGYAIYNIPINPWALVVLVVGVFPFILALRKSKHIIFMGLSLLAMVIGSTFLFRGDTWWKPAVEPLLAIIVSVLVTGYFWIAIRNIIQAEQHRPTHDLGGLIGLIGEAKSPIHLEGSVQVAGELWSASSENPIPSGTWVRVLEREGFILKVEKVDETG